MARSSRPRAASEGSASAGTLEQLLASKEIVVTCGSGGVGKTTTAAALAAMAAAQLGGKVLVVTVDPARRLATALGLEQFGNVEKRVADKLFVDAGMEPRGELWAAMLDTKQSWDDLIRTHAPDAETRDAILANPLYQNVTSKFVQSHDYIAMERLYEIHSSGRYDLIVVDTPPTRNALDFLEAPERMADFFSSRLLRWLIAPYRSRLYNAASRPFYSIADRILGSQFLGDIAEFFILFQTMYDGFVERAEAVHAHPRGPAHHLRRGDHARAGPGARGRLLHRRPRAASTSTSARSCSTRCCRPTCSTGARPRRPASSWPRPRPSASRSRSASRGPLADEGMVTRVVREIGESFLNYRVLATREAEQRAELSRKPELLASVPYFDSDIHDLAGLLRLGEQIWR